MKNVVTTLASISALALLAACNGGGSTSAVPAARPAVPDKTAALARFVFTRTLTAAAGSRNASFIDQTATQSAAVAVDSGTATSINLTAGSPQCATSGSVVTCTLSVSVLAGTHAFTVTTYSGPNATGSALSTNTLTNQTVNPGVTNTFPLALSGIVAKVAIALGASPTAGTAATIPVTVTAKDAAGNTIVGADPYATPITITNSDTSGATTLSTTTVVSPATTVTLAYNGTGSPTATIGATASGLAAANVTPATLTITGGVSVSAAVTPTTATTVALTTSSAATLSLGVQPGSVSAATTVTLTEVSKTKLPAPLSALRQTKFVAGAGNSYVYSFILSLTGTATIAQALQLSGASFVGVTPGTGLNLALFQGGSWVDVGSLTVNANGTFTSNLPSATAPGIVAAGTYLIYQPATGTNTVTANFGIALIADDGTLSGSNGVQVVSFYDATGKLLATPTQKLVAFPNSYDLDGAALTPDGTQGVVIDGSNKIGLFTGVNTGNPAPAAVPTFDVSAYGSDGDAVALSPNGDEAVVALDSGPNLLVVSGLVSGAPKTAINLTSAITADGLVESTDGKVMLARNSAGVVESWSIGTQAAGAGPLGGSLSHTFTRVGSITGLPIPAGEDGRDGMAISPVDSTRALVVGLDASYQPVVKLVTGLPLAPVVSAATFMRLPASVARGRHAESSGRGIRVALPTGISTANAVAISPDGTYAVVGTGSGLVLISGVNTGALAVVGPVFQPAGATGNNLVETIGFTLDGKYLVTIVPAATGSGGTIMAISVSPTGFGTVASKLDGVALPGNDQILMH